MYRLIIKILCHWPGFHSILLWWYACHGYKRYCRINCIECFQNY